MRAEYVLSLSRLCMRLVINRFHTSDLTPLIPQLIDILTPPQGSSEFDEAEFVEASDALQEIMSKSALSGGSGSRTFTEPLLLWFDRYGGAIIDSTLRGKSNIVHLLDLCLDIGTRGFRGRCITFVLQAAHRDWRPLDAVPCNEPFLFLCCYSRIGRSRTRAFAH